MRRLHTPVARRVAARAHAVTACVRVQSSAAPAGQSTPTIRIRTRGYGPSSDLVRGLPEHAALSVEATLHPEDAAVQRAVLELSMPSLAAVHVTPVVPHDSYARRAAHRPRSTAAAPDVMSATEREVMERCLQEQLADVANLVVEQVGRRTGQQLDTLQVAHADEMRNLAEIVMNSIQDELRQLRLAHSAAQQTRDGRPLKEKDGPSASTPALDVEAVADVVSARVMAHLAQQPLSSVPASAGGEAPAAASARGTEAALAALEKRVAAHFSALEAQVQGVVSAGAASSHAVSEAAVELTAAVTAAVETASAAQQQGLATLVNNWMADMEATKRHDEDNDSRSGGAGAASVDMRALEEAVESAVQASTDELRRIITAEMKKVNKGRGSGGRSADGDVDTTSLTAEVERVFDAVQATQGRLATVDEVVGDVFREQAATRAALESIQTLLQQQLNAVTHQPAGESTSATAAVVTSVEAALTELRREVAAASAVATVHQEESQQQLLTVAQVVSDSVAAAVQQHTAEAVEAAMSTVQRELAALTATAHAATEAAQSALAAANTRVDEARAERTASTSQEVAAAAAAPTAAEPLSKAVLAEAVEAVLTPRWSVLSAEVERLNTANQLAIEQQLLHMANSVAASVTASLQEHLEAARVQGESMAAATVATAATSGDDAQRNAEVREVAESTASALAEKTTQQLASVQETLMASLEANTQKSHEVDLTPMYKYIDSVLTFMKEELNMQEASLSAKMSSLTDTVAAAMQSVQGQRAVVAEAEKDDSQPPAAAPSATASPAPVTVELPASLSNTLDAQAGALRHLEERLNEATLSQSRDMAALLAQLQKATEEFRAAAPPSTTPPSSPLPLHPDQLAWQQDVTGQLTSLQTALEGRDSEVLAAFRASASGSDIAAHMAELKAVLAASSAEQKEELHIAIRDVVSSSAQEQAGRVEALMQRVDEVQRALRDQAVAVQLLQPPLSLAGLTVQQQQTRARLRSETQEHLRRLTTLVGEATAGSPSSQGITAATAAEVRVEMQRLRELEEEEAALHRDVAAANSGRGDAAVTVETIVRAEVAAAQAALQESVHGMTTAQEAAHQQVLQAVGSLVGDVEGVAERTGSIPSIADIQQVLDATLVRLSDAQKDSGERVTQAVVEVTRTSAEAVRATVQTTLSEGLAAAVEQRIIPAYHEKVVTSMQAGLSAQTEAVTAAVAGATAHTSAAVDKVTALVHDLTTRHAEEAKTLQAEHHSRFHDATTAHVKAQVPWWWMLANSLLVCAVVLLSLYYVFACLLLAFVPKPAAEVLAEAPAASGVDSTREGGASDAEADPKLRRSGRYVDRFMV